MIIRSQNGMACALGRWPLDPERPTFLFIHGSGGDHTLWHNQLEALSGAANTMALDLPGHGVSRGPGCESVAAYAAAVADLLQDLRPPRPIPCGLSLGGAIVLQLLLDRPALLAGAVLISTGARLRVLPEIIETIETRYGAFVDQLGRMGASAKTDPELLKPVGRAAAACAPAVAAGDFKACDRFDVMGRLDRIATPVLVISAADDQLTPPKYADFLAAGIAGSRRVHIPDAGHLVPIEKPAAVNQALQAFAAQLAEGHDPMPADGTPEKRKR